MKRRDFLTTSCAASLTALAMPMLASAKGSSDSPMFIDFQMITAPDAEQMKKLIQYHGETLTPIANRSDIAPLGLFVSDKELNANDRSYDSRYDDMLFAMIPHPTLESITALAETIRSDKENTTSYAEMTQGTSSKTPLFTAHERMLFRCFDGFPKVEVPTLAEERVLQIRFYRSHNSDRNQAKIEMFTPDGELALFQECGMNPVFFSDMFFGPLLPCIVYMLSFESEQHMRDGWKTFVNHPKWKKMSSDPKYDDTATEITNIYLRPCRGSQI